MALDSTLLRRRYIQRHSNSLRFSQRYHLQPSLPSPVQCPSPASGASVVHHPTLSQPRPPDPHPDSLSAGPLNRTKNSDILLLTSVTS